MQQSLEDRDLVANWQTKNDKNALATLFKRHQRAAFGVAFYYIREKERAMDVVMDAFEIILKQVKEKEISNFKSWLLSIVRNQSLKQLRDRMRTSELPEENITDMFVESDSQMVYTREAKLDQLVEAVGTLKPDQQNCIRQFYLESRSYAEVAQNLDLPLKTVKSHIQNGKRNLYLILGKTIDHD